MSTYVTLRIIILEEMHVYINLLPQREAIQTKLSFYTTVPMYSSDGVKPQITIVALYIYKIITIFVKCYDDVWCQHLCKMRVGLQ